MIQFDYIIFFKWVGKKPPTRYKYNLYIYTHSWMVSLAPGVYRSPGCIKLLPETFGKKKDKKRQPPQTGGWPSPSRNLWRFTRCRPQPGVLCTTAGGGRGGPCCSPRRSATWKLKNGGFPIGIDFFLEGWPFFR